jgi:hypothetical protein
MSYVKERASLSQAALRNVTEFSECFLFKVRMMMSVFIVACVVLFVKTNCNWTQPSSNLLVVQICAEDRRAKLQGLR